MRRILIDWYYERQDLTEYLLEFESSIEFVFLLKQDSESLPSYFDSYTNISFVNWSKFKTPGKLLQNVKPDAVIFSDLEAFNQIALNIAARNRRIKTFVLQHGQRGAFEVEDAVAISSSLKSAVQISSTSWRTFCFLFSSLRLRNIKSMPALLKFILARKTNELTVALQKNKFELRRADFYIEFSNENAGYHKERDGVPENRFVITGNPLLDTYFDYFKKSQLDETIENNFYLLLDCPFTEANFIGGKTMTLEEKRSYLQSINSLAKAQKMKLIVKLHPLSYKTSGLPVDNNIIYEKECDVKKLTKEASLIFFVHFSTISPVLLAFKRCIYFNSPYINHNEIYNKLGVRSFELFPFSCTAPDLEEEIPYADEKELTNYIFKDDGKARERIFNVINS